MPEGKRRLAAILAADVSGYSRLMERDEAGTLAALKGHVGELIEPTIAAANGRVVKYMGDGLLAEFTSVVDAVQAAVDVQRGMARRNGDVPGDQRLDFRIGINVGDVIVDADDIFGDGVNVAARLEGLAVPGGICVSGDVKRQVEGRIEADFEDLGERTLKNIERPLHVFRIVLGTERRPVEPAADQSLQQEIRFCTTPDGVQIAYATVGDGPPLVKTANWLNHLEFDWQSPVWRHVVTALAAEHHLVRYDERGNGLSDWDAEDLSLDAMVCDLETVVDAAGAERFALLGISQGCAISVAYAVRHPARVSHLVLHGGFPVGWRKQGNAVEIERREAMMTLAKEGWGQSNPAFRQLFTSLYLPDATPAQQEWWNELQCVSTSPENAIRLLRAFSDIDVRPLLAQVRAPTLVLHARGDAAVRFERGRLLATSIPGARFVPLDSENHLIMEHEPAWPRFLAEIRAFLQT